MLKSPKTVIFMFAHQDDEFGVLSEISNCCNLGFNVIVIYLTTGTFTGSISQIRCRESLKTLTKLQIPTTNIYFLGNECKIADTKLNENLFKAFAALLDFSAKLANIEQIYIHAWEGGHIDHDAVHLLGVALAFRLKLVNKCRQFSLYNNFCGKRKILSPICLNGTITLSLISFRQRVRFCGLLLNYPSQIFSAGGILAIAAIDYLYNGQQKLQPVSILRLFERPHPGLLRYEVRKFLTYELFRKNTDSFLDEVFGDRNNYTYA